MVFYFSGTGNSLYIAKRIAAGCNDTVVSIPDCVLHDRYSFSVNEGESVGFVFPVIACAPPDLVTTFIKRLQFPAGKPRYLYSVFKCAAICPMEAITLRDGRPTRDQANCAFCLGCVNVCPTHALQVGKKTQGNPQYINPHYDGKARR